MFDYWAAIIEAIVKHGWSLPLIGGLLIAVYKQRPTKRWLRKHYPRLVVDDSDVVNYEARQIRIESKIDALMSKEGVTWDVPYLNGNNEHPKKKTSGPQMKSLLQRVAYAPVTSTRYFTRLLETYHSLQRRMKMKSKLLSRKFILALATGILVILNDGLDMGLDADTIMYVVGIVGIWIFGESAVDVSRKEKSNADFETPIEPRT